MTCDASRLSNASTLVCCVPSNLFIYGINCVVPIFFSNARARIMPRCLGDAYCLVSIVSPNGCSKSSRIGVTSATTAGWRACTSLRDAIDLPIPMPRNPSARPRQLVLAFIISLPFVYGVRPGIGSQQYAVVGNGSVSSRQTVQLIST